MARKPKEAPTTRYTEEVPPLRLSCQEANHDWLTLEESRGLRGTCVFVDSPGVFLTQNQTRALAHRLMQFADAFIPPPPLDSEDFDTVTELSR